jgi:predicted PolB exonuclease-like 3'-5' exonuclease
MNPLVFDIETWIDWDFIRRPEFLAAIESSYEPSATLKDAVKIAAHHTEWWMKQRKSWTFSALTARVCSIAWGDLRDEEIHVASGEDERDIIEAFAEGIRRPRVLTGFNVRRFDIPFLTARACIHGVRLPPWWPHERDYRQIADICDVTQKGKLSEWLDRCGLPPKTADGSLVEFMSLDEIRDYNRNDVHIERLLARRFAPNMPALRETEHAL